MKKENEDIKEGTTIATNTPQQLAANDPNTKFTVKADTGGDVQGFGPVTASPIVPFANATNSGVLTMSSREIAELTGKEHFNVRRDIKKMLGDLNEDALKFEGMSSDAYGRPLEVFNLPKDLTITLVSGYNVQVRHRIVTRWIELEEKARMPAAPTNFLEAMKLVVLKEEERLLLAAEVKVKDEVIEVMTPKAEFYA